MADTTKLTTILQCKAVGYGYDNYNSSATRSNGFPTGRHGLDSTNIYRARITFDGIPKDATIHSAHLVMYIKDSNYANKSQLIGVTNSSDNSLPSSTYMRSYTTNSGILKNDIAITAPMQKFGYSNLTGTWYVVVTSANLPETNVVWDYDQYKPYVEIQYTYNASVPTVSPSIAEFGQSVIINTNRKDDSYTHTLTMSLGSNSVSVSGVGSSYNWTIPSEWSSSLSTTTSGTVIINCETFDGSSSVGNSSTTLTVSIPAGDLAPDVTTVGNIIDPVTNQRKWVSGISKVQWRVYATPKSGASMRSYSLRVGNDAYSINTSEQDVTLTSSILNTSGVVPISITCTDTRGYYRTLSTSITVVNSKAPVISLFEVRRCSYNSYSRIYQDDPNGQYARFSATAKLSNDYLDNKTLTCVVDYKKGTDADVAGNWKNVYSGSGSDGNFNISLQVLGSYNSYSQYVVETFDVGSYYNFRFTVTDTSGELNTSEFNMNTRSVVFDVHEDGTGFAIGMVSGYANKFEVLPDTIFYNDVEVKGNLTVQGSGGVDVVTPGTKVGDVVPAQIANKLSAEKTISLGGILNGSTTFDGSDNVTISAGLNSTIFGTYYGGTGVRASNALEMFRQLGLDIRTGQVTGVSTSKKEVTLRPSMQSPIILTSQTSGNGSSAKITDITNTITDTENKTVFKISCGETNCTYNYVAISWNPASS